MHETVFSTGPIVVRSYALMLAIAFLAGAIVAARRAKRYGVSPNDIINLTNVIIITSILGSRTLFVLEHKQAFSDKPLTILYIWQGGFSYFGGIIFAVCASLLWAKMKRLAVGRILDIFTPSIALGFFFVRTGCFLNGCCFGKPTTMPWGVIFPPNSPAGFAYRQTAIHPTQLYEVLSALIGLTILMVMERKWHTAEKPGLLFFSFLILSGSWRFIIEFYRHHESSMMLIGQLSAAQAYSIAIVMIAAIAISLMHKTEIRR